jgi:soluble lytic murein transglycosylase-like protein
VTVGQVLATIALVAQVYGVPPAQMECIAWHESRHDTGAVNGIHQGLYQYNPATFSWMLSMALDDPGFLHGYLFAEPDAYDPMQAITLTAWALRNGYGEHWSAYRFCWDIR